MNNQKQTFAFKLAEKASNESKSAKQWSVRDDVSVAGCSMRNYETRESRRNYIDAGAYC